MGRIVIVTGAASGIGLAVARRFAAMGDQLVLLDKNPLPDDHRRELHGLAGADHVFDEVVDVSRTADVARCIGEAHAALGPTEVLVNNAGIGPVRNLVEMSEDEWDETIDVNLKSLFNTCRAAVPAMVGAGQGTIVNVASELGLIGRAGMTHYCAVQRRGHRLQQGARS